ncbi:dTDP-4-amino-4,6-dideoxygalactose transaminase [Mucilaginibacter sp. OK268]|uniref:DegT/DnrJ/EryC1/StrS family aminotransferase n=1 Tax=Mucilaginibacter sp. OK268 TaxID=1881048 RepID=UPI0008851D04|nr:DegT/DnrJ/EryC1/StrS family aminotransferase [Mucilaginibacter sp. OK268]SDP77025.1 dTDP-4-amino-4,6-dideoxygalactose transaminase [Mucilaginibacter sp. OK268]
MIPVTKPFLPSEKEFKVYVKSIWERQWLTNNGPLVNTLELKLKEYLGLDHMLYVSNGTMALQLAIKALNLTGEIITTPFSFVATTSTIVWQGCRPVFVDIDANTFNIDPTKIEAAITPNTSAILATHVYGNACDIDAIQQIADRHGLKVIYDAAHCFGTRYKNRSIFEYGDISTTSFHSTKLFHTIEGGAVFTRQPDLLKKMALMRNFGYSGVDEFAELGINAKNCEFHAAMGLCNLPHIDEILKKRKYLSTHYKLRLNRLDVQFQQLDNAEDYNYAYFPLLFKSEDLMKECKAKLELAQVYCRRYFYPSLSALPYVENVEMPVCDSIASRIMCLPMYHTLTLSDLDLICRLLLRIQNNESSEAVSKSFGALIADQIESEINIQTVKENGA